MSRRLAAIDESRVMNDVQRQRAVSFSLLGAYLTSEESEASVAQGYEHLWTAATGKSVTEFVSHGTPFFWQNVRRCLATVDQNWETIAKAANLLLRTGFDSYFDWMPDGTTFWLDAEPGADLVLPSLGVKIPADNQPVVVRRIGPRRFEVELADQRLQVDLDNLDSALRLPVIDILDDEAKLLVVKDRTLFEDHYINKIAPETSKASFLAQMIGKSLEMIQTADPSLASRFKRMIQWYVPISTPGPRTHDSMTVMGLQGVMFLSEAYHDIRLAEAMVHEYYHNELNLLQESQSTHEEIADEVFYSPWRPDSRPLGGLLHALYVFSGVANFIARAEQLPALAPYIPFLRNRRKEVISQVRLGLAQVPSNRLTSVGSYVIDLIEYEVEQQEADLGRLQGPLPKPMAEHLAKWKAANPDLSDRVRVPDGVEV